MNWLHEFTDRIGGHIVCQNEPRGPPALADLYIPQLPARLVHSEQWIDFPVSFAHLASNFLFPGHHRCSNQPQSGQSSHGGVRKRQRKGLGRTATSPGFLPGDNVPALAQWIYFYQVKSSKELSNTSELLELESRCSRVVMSALSLRQLKYFVKPENSLRH